MSRLPVSDLYRVTPQHVRNALAKLREPGCQHAFGPSTDFDLMTETGDRFPPKAVFGIAASEALGFAVEPRHFTGGLGTPCFSILTDAGFRIVRKDDQTPDLVAPTRMPEDSPAPREKPARRNPPWSRDELIVALDFYITHAPAIPAKGSPEIAALSETLNRLGVLLDGQRSETFRNVNGVYMKLMNFLRFDHSYTGKGLQRGNQDEEVVWRQYADKPEELHKATKAITRFALQPSSETPEPLAHLEADEEEAQEGRVLTRVHRYRERDKDIVTKKKEAFRRQQGRLYCEACGFDFAERYGSVGDGFIECHHTRPVSELHPGEKTKQSDLALLCANCHRMIHRKRPWLSLVALRALIKG